MAAKLVVEAFLSSLFGQLFDKLASPDYFNFFRGLKLNDRLLKKLKIMMCSANQLLDDAEMKQFTKQHVREWLSELKDAIYVAEELLDDINYETLRYDNETKSASRFKKLKSTISSSCTTFDQAIEEILDRLEHIVKQKDVLGLKQGVTNSLSQRLPAPLANESHIYGRHGDKEKIIELLLLDNGSSKDKISVIPIVGMGGIGKTTLAQLVYEDNRVKSRFSIRPWVTISDESDHFVITKKIVEEITSQKCGNEDLYKLQCKLKEAASEKRFLFVLDDVWTECYEHWEVVLSPLRYGAYGSRIIVTTRSENVARNMGNVLAYHLETISDDDCWMLFEKLVFENTSLDAHADLPGIGREIVKKCKGVPLAVKSLAGLLRSVLDPMRWKEILNSDIWELQSQGNTSNSILPSLCLSYHHLPLHLKRCFAYCSIFPKDYEMDEDEKKRIIQLWMAEGLLQPGRRGKQIEDVGNEYFEDLISRSLFQPLSKDKTTILMHDLTHDLAVFVSGEFSSRLGDGDKAKPSGKTRYFSYLMQDDYENFEGLSSAKCLRTCLLLTRWVWQRPQQRVLLPEARCVRALSLCGPHSTALLDLIGDLKNLRYLDFSHGNIKEIPNTLCSLYNLQTLRLSWCRLLTQLPTEMGNLVKLRHLHIEGVPLEKMPPNMRNLEDLQTLSDFVLCKTGGSNIKELSGLRHLSGQLEISMLENVDVEDVTEANLMDKGHLKELVYSWRAEDNIDGSSRDIEVLDALQPHTNLKGLSIRGYRGEALSKWLGYRSYTKMVVVRLHHCHNLCKLPSLGQLPSLQTLGINSCPRLERIGVEFYYDSGSSNIKPFRSLKSLAFDDMAQWQEWSFPAEVHEDGGCFPSLEELTITGCKELQCISGEMLPTSLTSLTLWGLSKLEDLGEGLSHVTSLKNLEIDDCEILQCLSKDGLPTSLTSLKLRGLSKIKDLGGGLSHVTSLKNLEIYGCENLRHLLEDGLPTSLTSLKLGGLSKIENLGGGLSHVTSLENLEIYDCVNFRHLSEYGLPTSLTSLVLRDLSKIEDLGENLNHVTSLKNLKIYRCKNLRRLSEDGLPTSLTSLKLGFLENLEEIGRGFFRHLIILQELEIFCCENLQYNNSNTQEEEEENTGKRGLQHLIFLKKLTIEDSEGLQSLLEEGLPTSLTFLSIRGFPNLKDLNRLGFQHLNSLERLRIWDCKNLECLPEEGLPSSLSFWRIEGCPLLEARYGR